MGNAQLTNMGQNFKLIVGLGNPGREYQTTRHNIGASMLLQLASALNLRWQNESKFSAELAKTEGIILLRPTTYMNLSGQSVGAAAHFYRIVPEEILVVHDELDLLPGEVRLKQGGGHAGHNGLSDIDSHLSSRNYWRLRLGIGHPKRLQMAQQVADYVLSSPRQQDALPLATAMDACVNAWPEIKAGDVAALQRRLHSLTAVEQASAAPN